MELTGRVTANAVIKTFKDERQVINFSIAINDYVKPKDAAEGKEYTLYVSCSFWRGTGVAAKLVKGALIEVSGRMYTNAYLSATNEPKASTNFHCNSIKVHGVTRKYDSIKESNYNNEMPEQSIAHIAAIPEPMEDAPF